MRLLRFYILDNPVLRRELRLKTARRRLWAYPACSLVAAVAGCLAASSRVVRLWGLGGSFVVSEVVSVAALVFFWSGVAVCSSVGTADSISREKQQGTFDLLASTPISAGQVLAGKLPSVLLPVGLGILPLLLIALRVSRLPFPRLITELVRRRVFVSAIGFWLRQFACLAALALLSAAAGVLTGARYRAPYLAGAVALGVVVSIGTLLWALHHEVLGALLREARWTLACRIVDALLPWLAYLVLAVAFFAAARWRLARHMRGEGDPF